MTGRTSRSVVAAGACLLCIVLGTYAFLTAVTIAWHMTAQPSSNDAAHARAYAVMLVVSVGMLLCAIVLGALAWHWRRHDRRMVGGVSPVSYARDAHRW